MTTGEFATRDWVDRLARTLEDLARIQDAYSDELYSDRAPSSRADGFRFPDDNFQSFYWRACRESRFHEKRYGPVRAALAAIRRVLAVHPAWAGLVDSFCNGEVWIQLPAYGGVWNPSDVIGGLMVRGKDAGEDGFAIACTELSQLLEPDDGRERNSRAGELLVGYPVVLVQGLMVREDVQIGDDTRIVPFERLEAFFDASFLERLAPDVARPRGGKSLAAIVKPFRWKPKFCKLDDDAKADRPQVGSFFKDAEVFIELLALFHAAPIVHVASISPRLHRTACRLLGMAAAHRSYGAGLPSWSFSRMGRPVDARRDAIDAAARAFADRAGQRYRNCAPVIGRLAEALARRGRFRTDDRILDVAIALEQMYGLDQGEISFKLKTRAACFLEAETTARLRVFKDVEELYNARSAIVHDRGKKKNQSLEKKHRAAFDKGFKIAQRSVIRLLMEGPPPDWNRLLLTAHANGARERPRNTKTAYPGFTNRNGQTVMRRTDTPGTDHNQLVYEMKCGGCRHRYGANGSDIWQRKCPECGGGRPGLSYS